MSSGAELLPLLYQQESVSGWSSGMRAISQTLLRQWDVTGDLLEIGCGAGGMGVELELGYPQQEIFGIDLHALALSHAQRQGGRLRLNQADWHHLPFPAESFGAVLALDTLDQSGVDVPAALAESWRVLRPRGMLLLRVSAYPWLAGAHDRAFGTGQRFYRTTLLTLLAQSRFAVVRVTYANTILALPIILIRLLQRWHWLPFVPGLYGQPAQNRWLRWILQAEARWLARRNLPFGISLYALARKVGS